MRTSRTVAGERPVARAISRRPASGWLVIIRAACWRCAALLSGRTRPSRPIRSFDCGVSEVEPARITDTVLSDSPVAAATARSDQFGCEAMMLSAAAFRSGGDSGRPCVTLAFTARTNAVAASQSIMWARITVRPLSSAAWMRCIPSITCIVGECTMIGGSRSAMSASARVCTGSSPANRGEPPRTNSLISTMWIG